MGPFGEMAATYCRMGLAPTPTGGHDGKRPMLAGYNRRVLNASGARAVARKFADANIALLTGPSRLNVVDIDEPALLRPMLERFGETPLIVRTAGRGGFQAYYRASPHLAATDLRATEGIAVEIKAGGNIVIAPPSRSPVTGRTYECIEGQFDAATLAALPRLSVNAVFNTTTAAEHRRIAYGHRNVVLFSICLRQSRHVDDFDTLLDIARTRNDEAEPPLDDDEVARLARSAWSYQTTGRNFVSAGGHVVLSRARIEKLCEDIGNPIALALRLELEHAARVQRGETFAISRRAMADAGTLPGWSQRNIRTATEMALALGLIEQVEAQRGVFARYTLPGAGGGPISGPNVTIHASPLPTHRRRGPQ